MNRSKNKCLLYGCLFLAMLGGCEAASSPSNNLSVNGQAADVEIFHNEQKTTFMVIGNYADCTWYVNGIKVSTGSSYTFNTAGYSPGEVCTITVTVTDAGSRVKRSGSIRVEIK